MHALFADMIDRLTILHGDIVATLEGLPHEALDWAPGPETNSLAVLATHVAQSDRYWIGQMAGGEDAQRVRSAEFEARGRSAGELIALLEAELAHSRGVIESLTLEDLGATYAHPERGAVRVGWSLLHALTHTALHAGHMQITRQLWDQRS